MRKITALFVAFFLLVFQVTVAETNKAKSKNNVGICLSGGAALGFAHIGVLQALEDNGIKPDYVSGASMGAIIGAFYAAGYSPAQIMKIISIEKMDKLSNIFKFPKTSLGFSGMESISKVLKKYIPQNSFESLHRQFYVCVTNLNTGEWNIKHSGDKLAEYVCASSAIPTVFEAQLVDGSYYVDGGLLNNLPVEPLREKCHVVIGVDVLEYPKNQVLKSKTDIAMLSTLAANAETHRLRKPMCDFYISCDGANTYTLFNFDAYKELYHIGYNRTIEYIKAHPALLKKAQ